MGTACWRRMTTSRSAWARIPATSGTRPSRKSFNPSTAVKAAGITSRDRPIERSSAAFTARASTADPSEKTTPGRRCRRSVAPPSSSAQRSARLAREVSLRIRRDERLEDVGEDLVLLGGVVDRGLFRGQGIRHRDEEGAAAGHFFLDRGRLPRQRPDLGLVRRRARVLAAQVRDRGAERQELGQRVGGRRGPRRLDAALHPAPRLVDAPRLPGALRREEARGRGAVGPPALLEDAQRGLGLAQRAVDVAGHALRLRQHLARLALQLRVARPLAVLEELERDLRDPGGVLGAEGVERFLRELQAVLDGLLGDVALPVVLDELGVDALEPAGGALLDELGVLAVERPAAAPRERRVEDVADDPARERQPIAARLPVLLQDAFEDQAIDRILDAAGALGQRLEVARVEGLADHGRDRQELAQFLRQPLDALLDRLLDGGGQGVGRDLGLGREAPGARVVPGDVARLDERTDELLGEEGVAFGRVAQPVRQPVRDLRVADDRFDERAVLGGGERRQRHRDEPRDRPRRSRACGSADAACPSRSAGSSRR